MEAQRNKLYQRIHTLITKKGEIAPFLYIGKPLEEINASVWALVKELCLEFWVDTNYIFTLRDDGESIKIKDMKTFMEQSYQKSPFAFQIFIIENYPRVTEEASNAALKFFEEPWIGNIIFLTAESEAGIMETILSRVQIEYSWKKNTSQGEEFWREKILAYVRGNTSPLVSYLYQEKLEKEGALWFLTVLFFLCKEGKITLPNIEELERDMYGLDKNNLLPRYIADKYLLYIQRQ